MRVAILAHEQFPDRAKTAVGLLRYGDHDVAAVIDRERAGERVADSLPGVQDAPILASFDAVEPPVDALVIGIAPIGGGFEESWRSDVRAALQRGCDVISGLHDFLAAADEFRALAAEHGADLRDVRRPPPDLGVSEGVADEVDARVVLTVGTDCSVGKMTTSFELRDALRDWGVDAGFVPTGQTGAMIAGWGTVVDSVVTDFAAGATERLVLQAASDHDCLVVEGQASLVHPAYSGLTTSILHGAMPDAVVLCHEAGRSSLHGYDTPIPDPGTYVDLYESLAAPVSPTEVVAGALDTSGIADERAARDAVAEYGDALDAPATDPVRFGASEIAAAVEGVGE